MGTVTYCTFVSVSAIAQNRGNGKTKGNVNSHSLHVFDSVSAVVENGGNVAEGGVGPVQAVVIGQQVVWLSDALVDQH